MSHLQHYFTEFVQMAKSECSRRKENAFLLNVMYHSPHKQRRWVLCQRTVGSLHSSPTLITEVRRVLTRLCSDSSLLEFSLREDGRKLYPSHHPMNRLPDHRVEDIVSSA